VDETYVKVRENGVISLVPLMPMNTSIIVWSKTIEESSNGITPCMVSETSRRLPVFVLPLTNDGTLFVLAPLWESQPYVQSSVELSLIGLQL
jgi:hypothetical protein